MQAGAAVARDVLRRLVASGRVVEVTCARSAGSRRARRYVICASRRARSVRTQESSRTQESHGPGSARGSRGAWGSGRERRPRRARGSRGTHGPGRARGSRGAWGSGRERRSRRARGPGRRAGPGGPGGRAGATSAAGEHTLSRPGIGGEQFCDAGVLRLLRRRSLAALREAVEPASALDFARFLPSCRRRYSRRGRRAARRRAVGRHPGARQRLWSR